MNLILFSVVFAGLVHAADADDRKPDSKDGTPAIDCTKSESLACRPKNVKAQLDEITKKQEEERRKALEDLEK